MIIMGKLRATAKPQAKATLNSPDDGVEEAANGSATARYRSRLMAVRVKMLACMVSRSKLSRSRQPSSPKAQSDAKLSYTIKGAVERYTRSAKARLRTCKCREEEEEEEVGDEEGEKEGEGGLRQERL